LTSAEKRRDLAEYRLKQARETLADAVFLMSGDRSIRSVVNRLYYAAFYSVLGLLVYETYASSKHSGVKSYFHKHFVRTDIFPAEMGALLTRLFEMRQRSDYQEYETPTKEEVAPLVERTRSFVDTIAEYLASKS
jgi:uncharacterized protein